MAQAAFDDSRLEWILRELGRGPLEELIAIFQTEAARLVRAASDAIRAGQVDEARHAAHTLKSSAAMMGAAGLAALCSQLEDLAISGSLTGAEPIAVALGPSLAGLLEHLDALDVALLPGRR